MNPHFRVFDEEAEYHPHPDPDEPEGRVKASTYNRVCDQLVEAILVRDHAAAVIRRLLARIDAHAEECLIVTNQPSDRWHKAQYEQALAAVHVTGPDWDSLDEDQKARIREANLEFKRDIDELAKVIRTGGPLPKIFASMTEEPL